MPCNPCHQLLRGCATCTRMRGFMLPTTGPVSKVEYLNFPAPYDQYRTYYHYQSGYRQKPPFDLRLPYTVILGRAATDNPSRDPYCSADSTLLGPDSAQKAEAVNKAYGKFVDKVQEEAMLLVNLKERQQTVSMIADKAVRLRRMYRSFRRGDWKTFAGDFLGDANAVKRKYARSKRTANAFLEVHFGWQPLIHDIYSGMKILTNQPPPATVKVRARAEPVKYRRNDYVSRGYSFVDIFRQVGVQMIANVSLDSQTLLGRGGLHMLNQFGILNPAAFLWEVIPFSFVVDWLANVGQVLGSLADFAGLTLSNAATTTWYETLEQWTSFGPGDWSAPAYTIHSYGRQGGFTRENGISKPVLKIALPGRLSVARALTAISLLVQSLPRR